MIDVGVAQPAFNRGRSANEITILASASAHRSAACWWRIRAESIRLFWRGRRIRSWGATCSRCWPILPAWRAPDAGRSGFRGRARHSAAPSSRLTRWSATTIAATMEPAVSTARTSCLPDGRVSAGARIRCHRLWRQRRRSGRLSAGTESRASARCRAPLLDAGLTKQTFASWRAKPACGCGTSRRRPAFRRASNMAVR